MGVTPILRVSMLHRSVLRMLHQYYEYQCCTGVSSGCCTNTTSINAAPECPPDVTPILRVSMLHRSVLRMLHQYYEYQCCTGVSSGCYTNTTSINAAPECPP